MRKKHRGCASHIFLVLTNLHFASINSFRSIWQIDQLVDYCFEAACWCHDVSVKYEYTMLNLRKMIHRI
jgi:hypothetical protein